MCQPLWQTVSQRADAFLSLSLRPASSTVERNWLHGVRAATRHFPKCCLWMCINVGDCAGCTSSILCRFQKRRKSIGPVRLQVFSLCYETLCWWSFIRLWNQTRNCGGKAPHAAAFALVLEEQTRPVLNFWVCPCFDGGFGLSDQKGRSFLLRGKNEAWSLDA